MMLRPTLSASIPVVANRLAELRARETRMVVAHAVLAATALLVVAAVLVTSIP